MYRIALLGFLLLLLCACAPENIPAVQSPGITAEKAGVEPAAVISEQTPGELKGFPAPAGFSIQRTGISSAGGDKIAMGDWSGRGTVEEGLAFFKSAMRDLGWNEEYSFGRNDGGQTAFAKDGKTATITLVQRGEELRIGVLVARAGYGREASDKATSGPVIAPPTAVPATLVNSSTPASVSLAPEMSNLPLPDGFTLIEGSSRRFTEGNNSTLALATWSGQGEIQSISGYYRNAMKEKGWAEGTVQDGDDRFYATFAGPPSSPRATLEVVASRGPNDSISLTIIAKSGG
jgi:hypothetical protein